MREYRTPRGRYIDDDIFERIMMPRPEEYDPILSLKILAFLLSVADAKMEFSFTDNTIEEHFRFSKFDEYMRYFEELNLLTYDGYGEDGWAFEYFGTIKKSTFEHLYNTVIEEIESKESHYNHSIEILKKEKNELMEYDPESIALKVKSTNALIIDLKEKANGNPVFSGITPVLDEFSKYLGSVQEINDEYENIYKNVIKPIKNEGQAGVKATAVWAILSIIFSTIISLMITNWGSIFDLFEKVRMAP